MTEERKFLDLTDNDIINNPYAYDEEQLIYTLETYIPSLRKLTRYQKLSAYICAKYVIFGGPNEDNGDCVEDRYLDTYDILRRQPHLTMEDMDDAFQMVEEELKMKSNDYNVNKKIE
jgi:hypothetical protein